MFVEMVDWLALNLKGSDILRLYSCHAFDYIVHLNLVLQLLVSFSASCQWNLECNTEGSAGPAAQLPNSSILARPVMSMS